ncbi:hypothetical protein GCM10008098_25290 [Rhodanobacter panaciterrae]|uniref:Secreted protein n=1 Tax=Rhodanobacter panaciterrae TaxID=490572 RepID=A0ABQ3A3E7_9GAMM|nr:hypothetical protein GCM10008098_25290 [Rhodanobacter panaciterrae]
MRFCAVTVTSLNVVVFGFMAGFAAVVVVDDAGATVSCAKAGAAMARQIAAASGKRTNRTRCALVIFFDLLACIKLPSLIHDNPAEVATLKKGRTALFRTICYSSNSGTPG